MALRENILHEWQATVANRFKGKGCPFCSGRAATNEFNFATEHPKLAMSWHNKKNGILRPNEFKSGSDQKIWWQCDQDTTHIWRTSIYNRAMRGTGCPYCSGKIVSTETSLISTHPEIASQWHSSKNGQNKPEHFSKGSDHKAWWQCTRNIDHIWQARISGRTGGIMSYLPPPKTKQECCDFDGSLQTLQCNGV